MIEMELIGLYQGNCEITEAFEWLVVDFADQFGELGLSIHDTPLLFLIGSTDAHNQILIGDIIQLRIVAQLSSVRRLTLSYSNNYITAVEC